MFLEFLSVFGFLLANSGISNDNPVICPPPGPCGSIFLDLYGCGY